MRSLLLMTAVAFSVACSSQRAPAEAALKSAQAAFDAAKAEASALVPDETTSVQDALAAAQASFDKGDYQAALAAAQEASGKLTDLQQAAAAKKAELTTIWTEMSASLPALVESVQAKVAELSKARRLPKGIDKETLAAAQSGLEMVQKTWEEAGAASAAGNLAEAAGKATMVKEKLTELMGQLGMAMPEAAPAEAK